MQEFESRLEQWVNQYFQRTNRPITHLLPITGDAGFRRYFRLANGEPLLAVYAPPEHENNSDFITVCNLLREAGVNAPKIFAQDLAQGFFLLQDLGTHSLLQNLTASSVDPLYRKCMDSLLKIQLSQSAKSCLSAYDENKLQQELNLFDRWFLPQLLGYPLTAEDQQLLGRFYRKLIVSALEQPQVMVHRDFHSRNLVMQNPDSELGVIDFQDAVIGAITYDLVSLLRDCYVYWPLNKVEQWASEYRLKLEHEGLIGVVSDEQFLRWFDWMGLQRHIKVLGIFARLSLRDGKHRYLDDLPLVVAYTRSVVGKYAELGEFSQWFEKLIMPCVERQPWFKKVEIPTE